MKFIITSYCHPDRPQEKDFGTIEDLIDWLKGMEDEAILRFDGDIPVLEVDDHIGEG